MKTTNQPNKKELDMSLFASAVFIPAPAETGPERGPESGQPIEEMLPERVASFWAKTAPGPNGCIVWTASKFLKGYGQFWDGTYTKSRHPRMVSAHRVAWTLEHGLIPPGLQVQHACGEPACVNHKHLRLGTHQDKYNRTNYPNNKEAA